MTKYTVVLNEATGQAEMVETDNPNSVDNILGMYDTREEAQERCDIENDHHKRGLFVTGKLKVRKR